MAGEEWRELATAVAAGRGPWKLPTEPPGRPEQLLTLVAHARLTEDEISHARAIGQRFSQAQWGEVMRQANREQLATLVYAQVAAIGLLPQLPPEVYFNFAEHYRDTLLVNLRIRSAQERLLDQLAAAGVEATPLKGVALAERLYGNLGWRRTRDIDLLMRREDVDPVGRMLRAAGYIPEERLEHANAFRSIASTETKFMHSTAPVVELHWGLSKHPAYRRGLPVNAILARAATGTWRGRSIRVLAPADELRYLAVHCTADHARSPLNWLVDITELARNLPADWRWDDFVAETIAAGLATPVGLALAQCRAVLKLDAPDDALTEMLRAAQSPDERGAWQSVWAEYLSREWIAAHLREFPSRGERALFAARAVARIAASAANIRLHKSP